MIDYVLHATRVAGVEKIVVVVGHKADMVRNALSGQDDVVLQNSSSKTAQAML